MPDAERMPEVPLPVSPPRTRLGAPLERAVVIAALIVAGVATAGHTCAQLAQSRRQAEADVLTVASLGASQMVDLVEHDFLDRRRDRRSGPGDDRLKATFESWARAVMRRNDAAAVALFDTHGETILAWPRGVRVEGATRLRPATREPFTATTALVPGGPDLTAAVAPLNRGDGVQPLAQVSVFVQQIRPRIAVGRIGLFAAGVFASALLAGTWVVRRMRREILTPLTEIHSTFIAPRVRTGGRGVDELDDIVLGIGALCTELDAAQQEARVLEKSIDTVVERRTKRMSHRLQRVSKDAERDPLTQLANRRFLDHRLEPLFREQRAKKVNLVVVMFDVDHFKTLNDTEGHAAGDDILRFLGDLLQSCLRETDIGVRYGGDEFAVFLVDISVEEARAIAERTVRLFAQQIHTSAYRTPVTLSAGIASTGELRVASGAELMQAADAAMYRSKRGGKNRVAVAT